MALEIRVPTLGESIVDAVIVKWLKQPGEQVARNEPVVELETDKVNVEVPAEKAGVLEAHASQEGDTVEVGQVLGTITEGATAEPSEAPAVAATETKPAPAPEPVTAEAGSSSGQRANPAARRMANERAVDLSTVTGSGPGGRIRPQDITASQPAAQTPAPTTNGASAEPPPAAAPAPAGGREKRIRMSRRRQTIAARLVEAQQTAAMLTTFNEVDMSAIMALRERHKEAFKAKYGIGLGIASFFVKASIAALREFPRLNAEVQGDEMVLKQYYDIGIAIGDVEGLVVPVLRDADGMTFAQIENAIAAFAQKVKDRTLSLEDLKGGTFTITNGGVFGSMMSTPILNPPQVGILGMHAIKERPVVADGQIVAHPVMYIALTYDHRVVDGRDSVLFLARIKELIEDPERLLLEG